jgi:hypothetical protein
VKQHRRNEWVTIAQAATRLNVTETLIRKWAERYNITVNPLGQYWFLTLSEIEHKTRHSPGARRKLTLIG